MAKISFDDLPDEKDAGKPSSAGISFDDLPNDPKKSEREILKAQGRKAVEDSAKAEPEYIEVPSYDAMGYMIGTERIAKPSKADPIGRGAMSVLPFAEDLGAWARSHQSGRTLSQEKMIMQGEKQADKEAYPNAYLAGQAAGIVPQLYLPAGLAARGTTALGRTALGAAEGAGYAGLTGLGEGITAEERLKNAGTGVLFGGVLGGALGRFAKPSAERAAPDTSAIEAAERLNVQLPYFAVTDRMPLQQATKISESMVMAGEPVIRARQGAVQQLEEAVNSMLPATTSEQAGAQIGAGIKGWITNGIRKSADEAYDEVRSLFTNPEATGRLNNTAEAVAEIMAKRAATGMEGTPSEIKNIISSIQKRGGLDFESAKYLMSNFRDIYLKKGNNFERSIGDAEVQKIYGALRKDVSEIAEAAGGQPARFFLEKADREYRAMMNMREKLQKIVGKGDNTVSDEAIFNRLANAASSGRSGDNALLSRALRVMNPQQIASFQAGLLSRMGRNNRGDFSADLWLGNRGINGLSPRAKAMIFKDQPQLLSALDDVTAVARRMSNLNQFGNPSGSGRTLGAMGLGAGAIADPVSAIIGFTSANIFTRLMSRPATAQSVADWSRRYEAYVLRPTEKTARALYKAGIPLSRKISADLNEDFDINEEMGISAK